MATQSRRTPASISERLATNPGEFELFQALRLLDQLQHSSLDDAPTVTYSGSTSLKFPAASLEKITQFEQDDRAQWQAEINIFGLTGSSGVLPYHYSELLQQRLRLRDSTLKSFFDLFNARLIHIFYKAWRKYRLAFNYEHHKLSGKRGEDAFTRVLSSLAGLGTRSIQDALPLNRDNLLGMTGILSRPARSAIAVEQALQFYFGLPIRVKQFQGEWLEIPEDTQSKLPAKTLPMGMNCQLGSNAILGSRGWQIQSKFAVLIQNISYEQLMDLQPSGKKMKQIRELTRFMTRNEFDFEVVITTDAVSIPLLELNNDATRPPLLGWNTALGEERNTDNIRIVIA